MNLFLAQIENGSGNTTADKVADFLYKNSSEIVVLLIVLISLVIALSAFLIILWRYYKKDALILKKYKIDPSNEDIEQLKKEDKNY